MTTTHQTSKPSVANRSRCQVHRSRSAIAVSLIFTAATSLAANEVLVLSSGNATQDATLLNTLAAAGHTANLGPAAGGFTAATSLVGYDAVFLQANYNWNILGAGGSIDMPIDGQSSLVSFVQNGGGLVTTEWLLWRIAASSTYDVLDPILPVVPSSAFRTSATATYTVGVNDSILDAGLPLSFTFPVDSISGTETFFSPRSGATVFFESDYAGGAGVIGGTYGGGRILSFSTVVSQSVVEDPNHAILLGNAVTWVSQGSPASVPEAGATTAIALASLAGFAFLRRRYTERPTRRCHSGTSCTSSR
ncbi:MAG TPA: hypothetical protein PLX89_20640 [Verrucomicrobiota bacterium]|nr:hypothetical protein [Verrucomicrobiota bacterium]